MLKFWLNKMLLVLTINNNCKLECELQRGMVQGKSRLEVINFRFLA